MRSKNWWWCKSSWYSCASPLTPFIWRLLRTTGLRPSSLHSNALLPGGAYALPSTVTEVRISLELPAMWSTLHKEDGTLRRQLQKQGIEWRFNPPSAPHFGGLWEAAVKSTKFYLRQVIGDQLLTFEEMTALLTQVEACFISRPLQSMTNDPDDLTPLTPRHFLIRDVLLAVPDPATEEVPTLD